MLWARLSLFRVSDGDRHVAIIDRVAKVQVSEPDPENILDEFIYKRFLPTLYFHVRKYWCLDSKSQMGPCAMIFHQVLSNRIIRPIWT